MNTLKKIYLDTSIISAFFDVQKPIRQLITEKWFVNEIVQFKPFISTLVLEEIGQTSDSILRNKMLSLIDQYHLNVLSITDEILNLAKDYRKKVIPQELNDSIHIATASCNKISAIVSWNFKHIVNLQTIQGIHAVNLQKKKSLIEIVTLENLGGAQYGNL